MAEEVENDPLERRRGMESRPAARKKVTRACDACKARKKACNGEIPCASCVRNRSSCTYDVPYHRGTAASPRRATQGSSHQHASSRSIPSTNSTPQTSGSVEVGGQYRGLAASARPATQANSRQHAPSQSSPSTNPTPQTIASGSVGVGGQYRGPASAHSFLDRAVRNFHSHGAQSTLTATSEDVYASIFSHGDRQAPPIREDQMRWPERSIVDRLVGQYFDFASPTYRILHQGTVERWIEILYGHGPSVPEPSFSELQSVSTASRAIILLQCAIASLFATRDRPTQDAATWSEWQQSETYHQMAEQFLVQETGAPSVESVQARFLTVLYLLSTSRMNRAWFNFGPTVQLLMALGIHRKQTRTGVISSSQISFECSKRVLWCSFTLDQYLSLILGRPRLLREEDIDQDYPSLINDENLEETMRFSPTRNCVMDAPVCHAKLSRILARASQDLYSIQPVDKDEELKNIQILTHQIQNWQAELPILLSDKICPSSLVSIFQRQSTVIRLAGHHAVMFVTRPLLLRDFSQQPVAHAAKKYLKFCITTAGDTLALVLELVKDRLLFPAFWYTQYIAFNALAIVYIYLIHVRNGRISHEWLFLDEENPAPQAFDKDMLYEMATKTQHYLGQASELNALAWRYSLVLEVLRTEAAGRSLPERNMDDDPPRTQLDQELESATVPAHVEPYLRPLDNGIMTNQTSMDWTALQDPVLEPSGSFLESGIGSLFADELSLLDFWPQLDRLPTCKCLSTRNLMGRGSRTQILIIRVAIMNHRNM